MQRLPSIMTGGPARMHMPQQPTMTPIMGRQRFMASYKKGGKVPKTGVYKLHKGERVIPMSQIMRGKIS